MVLGPPNQRKGFVYDDPRHRKLAESHQFPNSKILASMHHAMRATALPVCYILPRKAFDNINHAASLRRRRKFGFPLPTKSLASSPSNQHNTSGPPSYARSKSNPYPSTRTQTSYIPHILQEKKIGFPSLAVLSAQPPVRLPSRPPPPY